MDWSGMIPVGSKLWTQIITHCNYTSKLESDRQRLTKLDSELHLMKRGAREGDSPHLGSPGVQPVMLKLPHAMHLSQAAGVQRRAVTALRWTPAAWDKYPGSGWGMAWNL